MRALPASAALAATLAVAAGCGGADASPHSTAQTPTPPAVRATSSTPEPTGATEPTEKDSATATVSAAASGPVDRLLPTGRVPGLNATWTWQDGETGPAGTEPFGLCAKVDLASIGAEEVVQRTYFPPDDSDDSAAEQVATFPDSNTAARAWAVLKSWHDRCGKAVNQDLGLRVGAVTPVPVTAGSARWYLLSWQPRGEETGRFETFGTVLHGTRIAVLRMDHSGQDHDYPAGRDPMVGMVTAAAGRLG